MVNIGFSVQDLEYFLMIFVRMSMFVYAAPFFGMSNVPYRTKIIFAFFSSLILYQVLPSENLDYSSMIGFTTIIVKEAVVGILIGFSANICNHIIGFSGKIIDMQIGLSMVSLFDPVSREQAGITGTFYSYLVLMLLIITDMHHYILRALVDSYQLIPVNGMVWNSQSIYNSMLEFMSDFVVIGFRICLPVFAVMIIIDVVLGVLAKVSPQMNMFVIGMQIKILVGLGVMFVTISLLPNISDFIFTEMKKMMVSMIEGMY